MTVRNESHRQALHRKPSRREDAVSDAAERLAWAVGAFLDVEHHDGNCHTCRSAMRKRLRELETFLYGREGDTLCGAVHDWRLIDESYAHTTGDEAETPIGSKRRWYCTRCRLVEDTYHEPQDDE